MAVRYYEKLLARFPNDATRRACESGSHGIATRWTRMGRSKGCTGSATLISATVDHGTRLHSNPRSGGRRDPAQEARGNRRRRSRHQELERLSRAQGKDDPDIYDPLVIIGSHHHNTQDGEEAEAYGKRAQRAYAAARQSVPARANRVETTTPTARERGDVECRTHPLYKRPINETRRAELSVEARM